MSPNNNHMNPHIQRFFNFADLIDWRLDIHQPTNFQRVLKEGGLAMEGWGINPISQPTCTCKFRPNTSLISNSSFVVPSPSNSNPFFPSEKAGKSKLPFYLLRPLIYTDIYKVVENQNWKPLFVFSRRQKQKFKETKTVALPLERYR